MGKTAYLLVNFGGPRDLTEIEEFLIELLTDQEVIRTPFPPFFHKLLFTRVAKKRSKKIAPDYASIGGRSPIFKDTEELARSAGKILHTDVLTFHRYLPKTHAPFLERMESLRDVEQIRVVPMFPQFSYATTGSIALWFAKHLSQEILDKIGWIKSYPGHHSYISAMEKCLRDLLREKGLLEEETVLLFSAHGLPQQFICTGDVYEEECLLSFDLLKSRFPSALCRLSYQSQFGKEEWIRPYTAEVCEKISDWIEGRKNVVVVPLSFTSDHIETLYEIEELYVGLIRKRGLNACRCPALNLREDWVQTVAELFNTPQVLANPMLIRRDAGDLTLKARIWRALRKRSKCSSQRLPGS
jgi:ferrochelatase